MPEQKLTYNIGIEDLYIVMMKSEDTSTSKPVYDTVVHRLPIITKMGIKGNGATKDKWASNKLFRSVTKETKHELSLDYAAFESDLLDAMRGLISTKGVTFNKTDAKTMPFFALGFGCPLSDGLKGAKWYPKVSLASAMEEEYETDEEESEIKDRSITMNAQGLIYNEVLDVKFDPSRSTYDGILFEDFMKAPIFEEVQLSALSTSASSGGSTT